jgi:DNA-binding NarL/FixJ family response regulator
MGRDPVGPGPVSGRRVLIVDDHAGFRTTARRLLESIGCRVVGEAGDGASAIAAATRLQPDAVLLDIGLPDLDGLIVAERLASPVSPDVTAPDVILVSSRERDAFGERIEASPAVGFIGKHELDRPGLLALLRKAR